MSEFSLKFPFGIDNGELDDQEKHECFVLGYALGSLMQKLLHNKSQFSALVRAENKERVERACEYANRKYSLVWMSGDTSEAWMELFVEAD